MMHPTECRRSFARLACAVAFLALARALDAQQIHAVPAEFATIQEAIDASAPGDIVLVRGGVHTGPITIDRPLTLMGAPRMHIRPPFASGAVQPPAIRLAGSGTGKVLLQDVEVGGFVNGLSTSFSSPGIDGGGFEQLQLVECAVDGPRWVVLTGVAEGSPALRTDVADVLIERSVLRGANSGNDGCYGGGPGGPAGIEAPSANLVVLDSTVRGGGSDTICGPGFCPTSGGAGGPGIVAERLWEAASDIQGGAGALYRMEGEVDPCGAAPDGAATLVVQHTVLGTELVASGSLRMGKPWQLTWSTTGTTSMLFLGSQPLLPPLQLAAGLLFVDPGSVFLSAAFGSGSGQYELQVPLDVALLGREVVAQVLGDPSGWTRPWIDFVRPSHTQKH